jgi:hypothetical protein
MAKTGRSPSFFVGRRAAAGWVELFAKLQVAKVMGLAKSSTTYKSL